jgi:hypothetical protein
MAPPRARYSKGEQPEFYPDAWERFERAVKTIAKAKPKHRPAKKAKAKRAP